MAERENIYMAQEKKIKKTDKDRKTVGVIWISVTKNTQAAG